MSRFMIQQNMKIYAPYLSFINPCSLYASYKSSYWREEWEHFYGWWHCSGAMNFWFFFCMYISVRLRIQVGLLMWSGFFSPLP